jgi:hypothetical protein
MTFSANFQNVLNHVNFNRPVGNLSSSVDLDPPFLRESIRLGCATSGPDDLIVKLAMRHAASQVPDETWRSEY